MKPEENDPVAELEHRHAKSIIYLLQCINKLHPSTCCPAAKHQNHNKMPFTNIKETPVDFFGDNKRAFTLAPAII